MARKGSSKVKTGCVTCKYVVFMVNHAQAPESELTNPRARKVKCDEGKPTCKRCTSMGLRCDGYPTEPKPSLTIYRPNRIFQSIEKPVEGRALQFFCETAAKFLSGPFESYFWTHLVLQFSNFEPAVHHSLLSISSLYEDFHCRGKSLIQLHANKFALRHYNAAIESLKLSNSEPLILLVCILFVCIEILQDNIDAAIQHSRHGILILEQVGTKYPWILEYLWPMFRRISVSPLFFGRWAEMFPKLGQLDAPIPIMFTNFSEAQSCMDAILCRALRLTGRTVDYRSGKHISDSTNQELFTEQRDLLQTIDNWHTCFCNLAERLNLPDSKDPAYCIYMLQYRLTRLRTQAAFMREETFWDDYIDELKEILNLTMENPLSDYSRPRFAFEVGSLPFIVFAIIRCRDLSTRLRGLRWLRGHGSARENAWDATQYYAVCKRLVELEHDLILGEDDWPVGEVSYNTLPAEEKRFKDLVAPPKIIPRKNPDGTEVWGNMLFYTIRTAAGDVRTKKEFLPRTTSVI